MKKIVVIIFSAIIAGVACGIIGFRVGLAHDRDMREAQITDMSVAASAAAGNMTRIWLAQLDNGEIKRVQESMRAYIDTEHTALTAFMSIPEVRERNRRYESTMDRIDRFLKEYEETPNRAVDGVAPR